MQEITINDSFGQALAKYSKGLGVGLEIGGGTGDGSTQCIKTERLYSFEIHPDRIGRHGMNLSMRSGGIAIHGLSSDPQRWLNEDQIREFYQTVRTNLNMYSIEFVLSWLKIDLLNSSKYKWESFQLDDQLDFLLLDGGAFSGQSDMAEWLPRMKEGGIIAMDDINDIKNLDNYYKLKNSNAKLLWEDWSVRNGAAIFEL